MIDIHNPLQSIQLMGLLNAAKTGNKTVDASIALVLPIVASYSLGLLKRNSDNNAQTYLALLRRFFRGRTYTQTITHRSFQTFGRYTSADNDSRNEYLIRAIKLYINAKCNLDLDDVDVDFSDVAKRKSEKSQDSSSLTTKRLLSKCEIVKKPKKKKWICMGVFGGSQVWMRKKDTITDTERSGSQEDKLRTVTVTLRSTKKTSIDQFTANALQWYEDELEKLDTCTRYFYDVSSFSEGNSQKPRCPVYHKYELTGEKTFKTIFSQQTKNLLRIVDDFRLKRGKYGAAGFPYKLGILLHGEPGTGKTSVIKALAEYLGRHIVNVSLSKVERDQDLRDIFFNREGSQRNLTCEDVIFVLEDVDATSKVVTRRNKQELNDDDNQIGNSGSTMATRNGLCLAGILNVFDGTVATPGRVIVMTTNHPELLDPALIRPGRIDKIVELSYMTAVDAIEMLEHYFSTQMDKCERDQLTKAFEKGAIVTPAQMERFILELDTIQQVVDAIGRNKHRRL